MDDATLARFELTGMTLDRQKPVQAFQSAEGAAVRVARRAGRFP